jgi:hypothetical protein
MVFSARYCDEDEMIPTPLYSPVTTGIWAIGKLVEQFYWTGDN